MENNNTVYDKIGVLITLTTPEHFLLVKETLTRIGIESKRNKSLFQSCHILHKRGEYKIVHFKELFMLDKKEVDFCDDDFRRRNSIAKLLDQWKLCKIVNSSDVDMFNPMNTIRIITNKEKSEWELVSKYIIGNRALRKNRVDDAKEN